MSASPRLRRRMRKPRRFWPPSSSRSRTEGNMAKLALINREAKRAKMVAKYAAKRAALNAIIDNAKASEEERHAARLKLQSLPRDSAPTRQRNRCALTGRPRGVFRKFGLGRLKLRDIAMRGDVTGVA